jgi:hypothetical protein
VWVNGRDGDSPESDDARAVDCGSAEGARVCDGSALTDTSHSVLAQIVPMRFCSQGCAYCNEYDLN